MKNTILLILVLLTSTLTEAQHLKDLIQEAVSNSPEIQKYEYQYKIASEKINEVNSLPNTDFNVGYMAIGPEMDMPMERFRVSVMQMIPWFGTLSARKNYASSMADAQYVEVTIAKRKLALSISENYYQLYEIKEKQEVLEKNITLLQTYERLALTALEVGRASAVDVLRLKIRQNELRQEIDVLIQQNKGLEAALNSLMNRAITTKIDLISSMEIPKNDDFYNYESLAVNPELVKYDKLYESVEQSELVNQKESGPTLGFGVEYINQENSSMITSPFKDMVMPMVSLSIPIFNKKYKSQTIQNDLRKQEIQFQKEERLNVLSAELSKAISLRNQARIKFNTLGENLKQAEDAEEILLKTYETGTIDYKDVLDIQELQLKFQMGQIEAIKLYYVQTVLINYLTHN
ncbi:MAG: TolC family protein [Weeksellaceae bacterium]